MTCNSFRSWSKPRSVWDFSPNLNNDCTCTTGLGGDICTLVTGHAASSDLAISSVISPKGFYCDLLAVHSKTIFIIILLLLTEGYRFKVKCFAWQENQSETHLPEIQESVSTIIIKKEAIHQVKNIRYSFCFCPKQTVTGKTAERGRTPHLIEQLSKDRT